MNTLRQANNGKKTYGHDAFLDLDHVCRNSQDLTATGEPGCSTREIDLEPGLQVRIWNCTFKQPGMLHHRPGVQPEHGHDFILIYFLTPGAAVLEECPQPHRVINERWNTVLLRSDAQFKVQLLPGKTWQCVSIHFSSAWLTANLAPGPDEHPECYYSLISDVHPFILFESISPIERKINDTLFRDMNDPLYGKYCYRSRVLNLVAAFFNGVIAGARDEAGILHQTQVAQVQQKLSDHIYTGLPSIGSLAEQALLSPSILKRCFKKLYGWNIYRYYQEKRMICARQLLVEKGKTVPETASIMGYGSVSSFNHTFKRFFGLKPGHYQKMNRVTVDI